MRGAVAREGLRVAAEDAAGRFLKLGITLHERGDYPSAEVAFRKAIFATPESPDLYLYLGELLKEKKEWFKVEDVYRDASKDILYRSYRGSLLHRHRCSPERAHDDNATIPHSIIQFICDLN